MARPQKDGLDYFPKDTDFYRDRKIRALIGRFGADGVVLYDYILCEVYRDGYCTEIDDSFRDIAAADLKMSPEKIGLILDYLLNQSMLLDSQLFKAVKVLTSRGIQTRYQEAVRQRALKRGICVNGKLWLLDEAETESFIQVRHDGNYSEKNHNKSEKNDGFSMEEYIKERKVKKSKVNEMKTTKPFSSSAVAEYYDRINAQASPRSMQELLAFEKAMGKAVCSRAMDIALDNRKATWSYIRAILQRWSAAGVKCVADIDELEQKREQDRDKSRRSATGSYTSDSSRAERMKKDLERLQQKKGRD